MSNSFSEISPTSDNLSAAHQQQLQGISAEVLKDLGYPAPQPDDILDHQKAIAEHRQQDPGYVEWTDVNPVEYDLDEAATIGALHQASHLLSTKLREAPSRANGQNNPNDEKLLKGERARIKASITDRQREAARAGIEDARGKLRLINDDKN